MPIPIADLLEDFSVEMTGKDVPALRAAESLLPAATRVNVTFLGNESLQMRVTASEAVRQAGLVPVPHVAARRVASPSGLAEFLNALRAGGTVDHLFVVAGDPSEPEGPYRDALDLITAGELADYGVQTISISGYPEGHPHIPSPVLWDALDSKATALAESGMGGSVITQFGFDVDPVIDWIEQVRARGIQLPIRVGVPGPAGVRRLLSYAARFGVGSSAGIAKKYGFSITNLLGTAGPDRFIEGLAARLDPERHGVVRLHFFTFGGLKPTAEWVRTFSARSHMTADAQA